MALTEQILKEYLHMTHLASKEFRGHYGKMNLTFPQALVLSILSTEGEMPISMLAELAGSANSTISGVVDRLERMKLVQRVRSDTDRRVIYVAITDHYQQMRMERATGVNDYFQSILQDVPQEDQEMILKGVTLLTQALEKQSES